MKQILVKSKQDEDDLQLLVVIEGKEPHIQLFWSKNNSRNIFKEKKLLISNSKYSMTFCWLDKYIRNNKFRISNL
jgi:hypothetical protein